MSKFGILASAGDDVLVLANHLKQNGRDVFIIGIEGIANADLSSFSHAYLPLGALDGIIKRFIAEGCQEIALIGHLKRPSLSDIAPDKRAAKILPQLLSLGDDGALRLLRDEFVQDGLTLVDIRHFMPQATAEPGIFSGGKMLTRVQEDAILLGTEVLEALGSYDIGQGCIVQGKRILAIEGGEGTDGMLSRLDGLVDKDLGKATMIKVLKSGQDKTLDPPGIGVETIRLASMAGVGVIAIEAGGVILIDKAALIAEAIARGITLVGIDASGKYR